MCEYVVDCIIFRGMCSFVDWRFFDVEFEYVVSVERSFEKDVFFIVSMVFIFFGCYIFVLI